MTTTSDVDLVLDAHADVGEGPSWDVREQRLIWVDITRHLVHVYDPTTGKDISIDVGQPVGAAAPRTAGGVVLAVRDGFALLDTDSGHLEMIAYTEADNLNNRMNDGKCDSRGRFWAGTMAFDLTPGAGALYRLETDSRVVNVLSDVTLSNGICWSPDESHMYYVDSGTHGVDVFDYTQSTGELRNRQRLIEVAAELGMPDGMTVDAEGFLWVSLWGGSAIHRYTLDGILVRIVKLPVSQVTSCCFGGEDLGDLYITSAAYQLSSRQLHDQPHAGGLFRYRPGVLGLPQHPYGG